MGEKPSVLLTGLQVFGLAAFVLAPPILFTLTNSPAFFLVHDAGPVEVIAVGVTLTIAIPLILSLLVAGMLRVRPTIFVPMWTLVSTTLFSFFVASFLLNTFAISSAATITLSLTIGAAAGYLSMRIPMVRGLLALLAPVALITLGTFVAQSEVVFPNSEGQVAAPQSVISSQTPVFVIILDELSTQALFDAKRDIDVAHFPNFARLARDGVWFRNATSVAEFTINAVPAILTGRYTTEPSEGTPTYNNYPENIFTTLHGAGYEVFSYESITRLCPDSINNRRGQPRLSHAEKLNRIFADMTVIAGHLFLPKSLTTRLPRVEGRVAHFAAAARWLRKSHNDALIEEFFDSIDRSMKRLYLLHPVVPHEPYLRLPAGKNYLRGIYRLDPGHEKQSGDGSGVRSPRAQQRYMLMVQYADSLIGRLIEKLEGLGIYDDSIVIVVADHGLSFRPGNARRFAIRKGDNAFRSADAATDIFKVPLFMKFPGMQMGVTRDEKIQTIDIFPTLTEALGIEVRAILDGRDLFATHVPNLDVYRYYSRDKREFGTHTLDVLSSDYDAERMKRTLDPHRFYAVLSPWDDLIGRPLTSFEEIEASEINVRFIAARDYGMIDLESDYIPALMRGFVDNYALDKDIALALNGTIVAIVRTVATEIEEEVYFETVVDPAAFRQGKNSLEAFEIRSRPKHPPHLLRAGT